MNERQGTGVPSSSRLCYKPRMPRGPGPVAAVHRLFIWSALVCALVYTAWELRELARTGETIGLLRAGVAALASVAIALYLRRLRDLGARLTPEAPRHERGHR